MKNLILLNRSGMGPDGTSRKGRHSLDPILSRLCLASLICLCMLTIGSGNAWGTTATFTPSSRSAGTLSGAPTGATATYYNSNNNANQITGGNTATLTLSGFDGCTISGLSLNLRKSSGTKTAGITASVNNSQFIDYTVASNSLSTTAKDFTITLSSNPEVGTGNSIEIVITPSTSSIYIFSYTITYTAATPKTVLFNTGAGNPSVSSRTEASGGAGITLPSSSDLTPACSGDGWVLYGWATAAYGSSSTTTAPSATLAGLAGATYKPATNNDTLYAVYKKTTGAPVARTLSATYASHTGWTESDNMCNNGYWVLCTGGTLTSPELVDLSTVTSITFNARTYGGASYKTVTVKTSGGTTVGSASAANTTMTSKTISVSGLSGSGSFIFSGSATTASYGPGMNNVVINYSETPALYWSAPTCSSTYTVTYNANGATSGSVPTDATAYSSGATVTVKGNTGSLAKTGYSFGGWNTQADGNGTNYTAGTGTFSITANTTLYAKWIPTYTVTYNGNDNNSGSVPVDGSSPYSSGTTVTVLGNTGDLAKTGWTFAGWNTNATGTGTDRAASSTFNISANTTLYAKWTCTVTWSVNKQTNVYSQQTVTYNSAGSKVASVPDGEDLDLENDYCGDKFMGWTSDENYVHGTSNLFTNVAGSPNLNSTGNTTFYAVFADYTTE